MLAIGSASIRKRVSRVTSPNLIITTSLVRRINPTPVPLQISNPLHPHHLTIITIPLPPPIITLPYPLTRNPTPPLLPLPLLQRSLPMLTSLARMVSWLRRKGSVGRRRIFACSVVDLVIWLRTVINELTVPAQRPGPQRQMKRNLPQKNQKNSQWSSELHTGWGLHWLQLCFHRGLTQCICSFSRTFPVHTINFPSPFWFQLSHLSSSFPHITRLWFNPLFHWHTICS